MASGPSARSRVREFRPPQCRRLLAHSSGEWIASDWPIGAFTDTATPHRMCGRHPSASRRSTLC
jgi:hypothetical protein